MPLRPCFTVGWLPSGLLQQVDPGAGGDAVLPDAVVAQVQDPQMDRLVKHPSMHHFYLVV